MTKSQHLDWSEKYRREETISFTSFTLRYPPILPLAPSLMFLSVSISNFSKKIHFNSRWHKKKKKNLQTHLRKELRSNQKGSPSRRTHLPLSPCNRVTHRCDRTAQFRLARRSSDPEKCRFHQFCSIHPQNAAEKIRNLLSANLVWQRIPAIGPSSWNHVVSGHPESFHERLIPRRNRSAFFVIHTQCQHAPCIISTKKKKPIIVNQQAVICS